VLTYELELRKTSYRFVRDGKCACLNAAIEKVIDSSDLLNLHFIIPITLGKRQGCSAQDGLDVLPPPAPHSVGRDVKGAGKGKSTQSWERQWGKPARTPEGKCICFKYNKHGGCPAGKSCRFQHVCQRCYHRHPFYECRYKHASPVVGSRPRVVKGAAPVGTEPAEDWRWERTGDEDGRDKPQLGAGHWGRGPPLTAQLFGKKAFRDGFGLCSPGRWRPSQRRCADDTPSLGFAQRLGDELLNMPARRIDLSDLASKLTQAKIVENPFPADLIAEGRELLFTALEYAVAKQPMRVVCMRLRIAHM
ncbi:unnamed protein product, partial [Symbiodinium necroappetens]